MGLNEVLLAIFIAACVLSSGAIAAYISTFDNRGT